MAQEVFRPVGKNSGKDQTGRVITARGLWLPAMLILMADPALGKKTNLPIYQEPFDIAAGGASLTRASQDGVMYANPALMPWGNKFHRWMGSQMGLYYTKASQETIQGLAGGGNDAASLDAETLLDSEVSGGFFTSTSWITSHFGIGMFGSGGIDLEGSEHGSATGAPVIKFGAEAYGGGAVALAIKAPKILSLGLNLKYVTISEPALDIPLIDQEAIADLQSNPDVIQSQLQLGTGAGFDVGTLFFLQGSWIDYRLAFKVDDVGNTKLSGGDTAELKQTMHVGTALTFHGNTEALHLALDYRDISGAYEEKMFKKVYAGVRLLLRNYWGFALGIYHGNPTFGAKLDFVFFRVGMTYFKKELTDVIGERPRATYMYYFALGF